MTQHHLDAGHRELLRVYLLGRPPQPEYFHVPCEPACCVSRCDRCGYPVQAGLEHQCKIVCNETVEFVPPPGEFSGCRCQGCPEKQSPKQECLCCAERRDEERHGDVLDPVGHYESEPRPFAWLDAERVMLAGGECESRYAGSPWTRCRINNNRNQYFMPEWGWRDDDSPWDCSDWRTCSASQQYTWEQADAGMRRGETWMAKHPAHPAPSTLWRCQGLSSMRSTASATPPPTNSRHVSSKQPSTKREGQSERKQP